MKCFSAFKKPVHTVSIHHTVIVSLLIMLLGSSASANVTEDAQRKAKINDIINSVKPTQQAPAGQAPAMASPRSDEEPKFATTKDGYLNFLSAPPSKSFPVTDAVAGKHKANAKKFLKQNRITFGMQSSASDIKMLRKKIKDKHTSVRFRQTYSSIPVFAADVVVQLNNAGGVEYVLSDIMTNTTALDEGKLSLTPEISAEFAKQVAEDYLIYLNPQLVFEADQPTLMIYEPSIVGNTGDTQLVWKTDVKSIPEAYVAETILINAHTAEIALNYSLIMDAINRIIHDVNNTNDAPSANNFCSWENYAPTASDHNDCNNAYYFLGDTYDFYFNNHGRDSIDDAGMTLTAIVRYSESEEGWYNAMWFEDKMFFGQGFAVEDILAHEFTHGVTELESGLIYLNQSGAINESFSDMWGEWIDQTYSYPNETPVKWFIGEDLPRDPNLPEEFGNGERNMKNPEQNWHYLVSEQKIVGSPDKMSSQWLYTGSEDNGGVHINSGVGNKLAYLLTDGDNFNGQIVTGMGITKTAKLFYEVQTNTLQLTAATYYDLYYALIQAAVNLNWSLAERMNLERACKAVEISGNPVVLDIVPADDMKISTITGTKNIDITFSSVVTGVDAGDMVLSGSAAAGAFVGTPVNLAGTTTWRFPVSGHTEGTLNIALAPNPGDIQDVSGLSLVPSPITWSYDVITCPVSDLNGDGCVGNGDLEIFMDDWLSSDPNSYKNSFNMSYSSLIPIPARFGYDVAIDGNFAVVGLPHYSIEIAYQLIPYIGAAHIYEFKDNQWIYKQELMDFEGWGDNELFGTSVDIDGDFIIVGAPGDSSDIAKAGAAFIFKYNGSNWYGHQRLAAPDAASNDYFGQDVAIEGGTAVIGAYGDDDQAIMAGATYIYKFNGLEWDPHQKLTASDGSTADQFGSSVDISGDNIIIGAYYDTPNGATSGSAYIFKKEGLNWSQQQKIIPSDGAPGDNFAFDVAIDGSYAIIGARHDGDNGPLAGSAYIFKNNGSNWAQQQKLTAFDGQDQHYFGNSVAIYKGIALVGAHGHGAAYTFVNKGGNWTFHKKTISTTSGVTDYYGCSVSLTRGFAMVGAYGSPSEDGSANISGFGFCPDGDFTGDCKENMIDYSIITEEMGLCCD
jgi:Zn-dependent metalloprotease